MMWNGLKNVTWRRCHFHHLYSDAAENSSFIHTKKQGGGREKWGVRPKSDAYQHLVIQDCRFHDRFWPGRGGHGGAIVFYTVHNSMIEDSLFERIHGTGSMSVVNDKDSGWGNTYRGNVIRGLRGLGILGQRYNDEIEICHNYIEGTLSMSGYAGWCRNIWVHHNAIRGLIQFPWLNRNMPEKIETPTSDAATPARAADYSSFKTEDSLKMVREFPAEKRLIHVYRNVIDANPDDRRRANIVTHIPPDKRFAEDWRCIRWDENLVDIAARVGAGHDRLKFAFLKKCGVDANGILAPIKLDEEGRLPEGSPYLGKYGR